MEASSGGSPFKTSDLGGHHGQSFGSIRACQRLTNDVTLMTALHSGGGLDTAVGSQNITSETDISKLDKSDPRLKYNRDSKACIPAYAIKATYNQ